ncbi:hypothetical protein BvRS1_11380 [Burkholderia vietnamiensis]|nr:hypothetical protein BvRS1_11380 [Burkholderia vietnamiensis]
MRDHAILALVRAAGRDDDHLPFGLAEIAGLVHQCVVVREERAKLVRAMRERDEHVRDEARLLLNGGDACANVVGQIVERGHGEAADGRVVGSGHGVSLIVARSGALRAPPAGT